jgi:hypothetical protein
MRNKGPTTTWAMPGFGALVLLLAGCGHQEEIRRLQEENARLRGLLASHKPGEGPKLELTPIREFIVGLAAAEKTFDEGAFQSLLKDSLQEASIGEAKFTVQVENKEQQIAKARGMLVQQYLSEQKVPIRISNVTYKLNNPDQIFKVGGTIIPRDGVTTERSTDGMVRCTFKGPLLAQMDRDTQGKYTISYEFEGSEGATGQIEVLIPDVEIFDPDQEPQAARQGDVALNWQLSLEKIQVYQVAAFTGDLGKFMHRMRYPRLKTSINQYQTISDSVFLFGYGPYRTGLFNRITTPRYIDRVEVLPITKEIYDKLEAGIAEETLSSVLTGVTGAWIECSFVEFASEERVWERPATVGFPFLSRQAANDKGIVFYTKYDGEGSILIGDYPLRGGK